VKVAAAIAAALGMAACASAVHEPRPVSALAPGHANGRSADELVRAANAAWARRAEPHQAEIAQGLFLDAAAADPHRVDALLGAMRALAFRIEHEPAASRGKLAGPEVELGQWCQRRAPANPECDYRLAIALGQQARERPSTGKDALGRIVNLLHRAIAKAPRLDSAGPHRVLALVLLRAPAWPVGPGDPEAALAEARAAVALFPDAPENQLVLGEALAANGHADEARAAYGKAFALASAAHGNPEAPSWVAQARAGMAKGH
jgi:tetratricopeptide (TPR) repeat protein